MSAGVGGNINFIGFSFAFILGMLILVLPRRYAVVSVIATACYMTIGQQIVVGGLHFSVVRIVILLGWIRLAVRGELKGVEFNAIDEAIILWQMSRIVMNTILWQTTEDFIAISGYGYDAIGLYFLFRFLIRDFGDIDRVIKMIAIIIVPLAVVMLFERVTMRNLFSVFGGVSEITVFDEGKLRCQGPFRHPILAGTFAATSVSLFVTLWFSRNRHRVLPVVAIVAAMIIVVVAASSGPILGLVFGVTGLLMWQLRARMRSIRWALLLGLIALHMVMKDPVWALIGRTSEVMGGTGYHRTMLINAAVSHFGDWWLFGARYTGDWLPYKLAWDAADITNQYIMEAVSGGVLTMVLFIAIIVLSFRSVGRTIKVIKERSFAVQICVWGLGATLFAHVMSFMSVSYFDQLVVFWWLLIAMISTVYYSSKTVRDYAKIPP